MTTDASPEHTPGDGATDGDTGERRRWRRVVAWVTTALACLLVLFALIAPNRLSDLTPGAFLRIPVEGLVGVALVLVLPERARRVAAVLVGVALGLLTILKLLDMGFHEAFDRPFHPALDGNLLVDAVAVVRRSFGRVGAIVAVVVAVAVQVGAVLDAGNRRLQAAGFAARSAFLTSPVVGGGSWLPHSTLQSGLWVNNQRRYTDLVNSHHLTLSTAFQRAGWRTVGIAPANDRDWPEEATFYGYDRTYDARNLGYRGPPFALRSIPAQYTLATFQRAERATPNHAPVLAEIDLLSSHSPWTPVPRLIDWHRAGDGSAYDGMAADGGSPPVDRASVRAAYRQSIEYSLNALISYVETYGDDNLVVVFLGDHQPAPIVTGKGASRDVPITIVARDRAVLDRISGWGWQDGLKPSPQAPVWRMDAFRDRFLTAFGPQPPTPSPSPPGR